MHTKHHAQLLIVAMVGWLLGSCGSDKKYDNPVDPASKATSGKPAAGTGTTPAATTGACLTTSCTTPSGMGLNFATTVDVTPETCTANAVEALDNGDGLMVFVNANCGPRFGVYAVRHSYAGMPLANPVPLTGDCSSGNVGVSGFAVDRGSTGYVIVYTCAAGANSFVTKSLAVTITGAASGSPVLFDTTTSYKRGVLRWNSAGAAFGYMREDKFQRFSESGQLVGGAVILKHGGADDLPQLSLVGDAWFVLSSDLGKAYCSKISAAGALQCDGQQLVLGWGSDWSSYSSRVTLGDRVGTLLRRYGGSFLQASAAFNASSCSLTSYSSNSVDLSIPVNDDSVVFGALQLNQSYSGMLLSSSTKSLVMLITQRELDPFAVPVEASIANYTTSLTVGAPHLIESKVYVPFSADGKAYFAFTADTIPQ